MIVAMVPFVWVLTSVPRAELPLRRIESATNSSLPDRGPALEIIVSSAWHKPDDPRLLEASSLVQLRRALSAQEVATDTREGTPGVFKLYIIGDDANSVTGFEKDTLYVSPYRHAWIQSSSDADLTDLALRCTELLKQHALAPMNTIGKQYRLTFSLLNEDPASHRASWRFPEAQAALLQPTLDKLGQIASLFVESQEIQYAKLAEKLEHQEEHGRWVVSTDALSGLVGANDFGWTSLAPPKSVSLNLAVFIPSLDHTPLVVEPDAVAFTIPDWGGVLIVNSSPGLMGVAELVPVFDVFVMHLRELLGIKSPPLSSQGDNNAVVYQTSNTCGITLWELDGIALSTLHRRVESTISSLDALKQLVEQMPHMQVLDRIARSAEEALDELQIVFELPDTELYQALAAAGRAESAADASYLDPTMIPQMYFPQEHIYAVYVPLWAPLAMPLIVGLVKEVKRYRRLTKTEE